MARTEPGQAKSISTRLCVAAWVLAATLQLIFMLGLPDQIVVDGQDLTHANLIVQTRGLIFVGTGLVLSLIALTTWPWGLAITAASASLYLVRWLPFGLIQDVGLLGAVKRMWIVGSIPGLRLTAIVRDVLLPLAFIAVIAFAIREWSYHRAARARL